MGFIPFTLIDAVDILVVALIMYYIYKIARGTPAPSILTGILLIYILWMVVDALQMQMLRAIMGHIIGVGVVALIVVFQPEIRRFLQMLGKKSFKRHSFWSRLFAIKEETDGDREYVTPLVRACLDMSTTKTGVLVVIQRQVSLEPIAETGIPVDALVTTSLLKNLFFKNSPLHDGAVIIKSGRIEAAKCVLPSTQANVPVSFGMRHRAALGVSEVTDAVVVVVSEETGGISIAHNGEIKTGIAHTSLKEELLATLREEE
jgi:uncharacterized protein (TIGR00159 family)